MDRVQLDLKAGYLAMYDFLNAYWERTGIEELAVMLGSMSLLADGSPADVGMAYDWGKAVEKVTGLSSSASMSAQEAYSAMYAFLETYNGHGLEPDIDEMLEIMAPSPDGQPANPAIWSDWLCQKPRRAACKSGNLVRLALPNREPEQVRWTYS